MSDALAAGRTVDRDGAAAARTSGLRASFEVSKLCQELTGGVGATHIRVTRKRGHGLRCYLKRGRRVIHRSIDVASSSGHAGASDQMPEDEVTEERVGLEGVFCSIQPLVCLSEGLQRASLEQKFRQRQVEIESTAAPAVEVRIAPAQQCARDLLRFLFVPVDGQRRGEVLRRPERLQRIRVAVLCNDSSKQSTPDLSKLRIVLPDQMTRLDAQVLRTTGHARTAKLRLERGSDRVIPSRRSKPLDIVPIDAHHDIMVHPARWRLNEPIAFHAQRLERPAEGLGRSTGDPGRIAYRRIRRRA